MAIFNSFLYVYQRVFGITRPRRQDTLQAQARSFYDEIPMEALTGHLATLRVTCADRRMAMGHNWRPPEQMSFGHNLS